MTISVNQFASNINTSGATITVAFGSSIVAGETIVAVSQVLGSAAATLADDIAGSYTKRGQATLNGWRVEVFELTNHAGGAATLTLTKGATSNAGIAAWRVSANGALSFVAAAEISQTLAGASADNVTTGAISGIAIGDVLLAVALDINASGIITAAGTGFTDNGLLWNDFARAEYRITNAANQAATFANTGGAGNVVLIGAGAFREAKITGTLATTEATDTFAAAAVVKVAGALATTEAVDTAAVAGAVAVAGALASTEAPDVLAASGAVKIAASLNVSESVDTFAASGILARQVTLAVTEASDTFVADADLKITATLATTEATDSIAVDADLKVTGSFATSESNDTILVNGSNTVQGSFAATEANDSIVVSAKLIVSGTFAASEAADEFVANASVAIEGFLNAMEASDSFAASESAPDLGVDINLLAGYRGTIRLSASQRSNYNLNASQE